MIATRGPAVLAFALAWLAGSVVAAQQVSLEASGGETQQVQQPEAEELPWGLKNRRYNTLEGTTGGILIETPSSGLPGSVRLQYGLSHYSGDGYLRKGDEVEQNRQHLSLSWTIVEFVETFMAIRNSGTVTDKPPQSLHTQGDAVLGVKLFTRLAPALSIGGGVRFEMLNDSGEAQAQLDATSIGLRGSLEVNLLELPRPSPFIGRMNLDYVFDNSDALAEDIETTRYASLDSPRDRDDENRHLLTRFERLALGIDRVDMFSLGLGVEVPVFLGRETFLHPLLEWKLGIPVNRSEYDCPFFSTDDVAGTKAGADDACLDAEGFDAWPMNVAIGVRVVPPIRGLTAMLGADFGLGGTDTFVRELAPVVPWRILFTAGYDYDGRPPEVEIVEVTPPVPAPPPRGRVEGQVVVDGTADTPVEGARVSFVNQPLNALLTDSQGRFLSYEFGPGQIMLEVTHPDYEPATCEAAIEDQGGNIQLRCALSPLPTTGALLARVTDPYDRPLSGAKATITGPSTLELTSNELGQIDTSALEPGAYHVQIEAEGHLIRAAEFEISARETTSLSLILATRPARANVRITDKSIRVTGLVFDRDSTVLDARASQTVAELADLLLSHPEVNVELKAPGDEAQGPTRATAIKERLTTSGVAPERVRASGGAKRAVEVTIVDN